MQLNGWIKLHRNLLKWEWYDDMIVKSLFIHLLLKANRENGKWRGVEIKTGQRFTSVAHLSTELKLSEKQIRNALKKLKKTGEIETKGASNGTMITICNYETYQVEEKPKGEQKGKRGANKGRTKGDKQEGEERREEEEVKEIYSLYPSKCPIKNSSTGKSKTNKTKIKSMLKNISADDLKSTIKRYIAECTESKTFIKNFGTFLNNLPDYSEPETKVTPKVKFQ